MAERATDSAAPLALQLFGSGRMIAWGELVPSAHDRAAPAGALGCHDWRMPRPISLEAAAGLIQRQFPALAPVQLEFLGVGLDNVALRVNGRLVFRFPRHECTAGLIEREVRVLPLLAPRLPLPIPAPAFVGKPDKGYPYPFSGYPLLPGTTACQIAWSDEEREGNAVLLGELLSSF
jgi:aminoglycoside phosphotransferase (APT) family kinase protein